MKKRLLLVAAGLACVLVAGYFVHAWLTKTRINRETFERIEVGMTLSEVEDLIGVPPGSYETKQRRFAFMPFSNAIVVTWHFIDDGPPITWSSNDGEITLRLSKEGRVTQKAFQEVELESLQETIWRRLGYPPPADSNYIEVID